MKYSKLKNEIEMLELQHKHEIALLQMKHEQAKSELMNKCTHKYEDGTSTRVGKGGQWNYWDECDICKKVM